jgi:hypothetical protein
MKVPDKKHTFELKGVLLGRLSSVNVYEFSNQNDNDPNLVWRIESKKLLSDTRFRITVPEIPDGYVQVLPKPPEQFQLRKGRRYRIAVWYSSGSTASTNQWVAE